jgi:hypothetical protein
MATGPEYRRDVSTAISLQTITSPGVGLVESVAAAFRSITESLRTLGDDERRAAVRGAVEALADLLAPAIAEARDEDAVSDALGEALDDPHATLALLRVVQALVAFAPSELPNEPPTRDTLLRLFGEAPELGRTLLFERVRYRVSHRLPKEARDPKLMQIVSKVELPAGLETTGFLAGLATPGLSPRAARLQYQMAVGNVALLVAACLVATGRPVPDERLLDLGSLYHRGLYAWLRWYTAFFPDDIPESVVPGPDRLDKRTEDARAAAREGAIREAAAEAARTGQATIAARPSSTSS